MSDLQERARKTVWHPFTQMSDWMDGKSVVIERGEGNYLIDSDGERYFDGVSSLWVNLHGHDHPVLRARIHEQLDRLTRTYSERFSEAMAEAEAEASEDET